jgi:hypothetical protein
MMTGSGTGSARGRVDVVVADMLEAFPIYRRATIERAAYAAK